MEIINVKKYFYSLVWEFIKDPKHLDITLVFKDYLKENVLGSTNYNRDGEIIQYTISFLNHYQNEEIWRLTVVHEFTHLYLFSVGDAYHNHDDVFYFHMKRFENWMDKKWGLTPRKDKSGDRSQHVDNNSFQPQQILSKTGSLDKCLLLVIVAASLICFFSYLVIKKCRKIKKSKPKRSD